MFIILISFLQGISLFSTPLFAENRKPLKVYYPVGDFILSDSRAKSFSTKQLKGKLWVAHIFFSSCEGPCPATSAHVAHLVDKFSGQLSLHFVSISMDPEHDTPARLSEYAASFKVNTSRWHFITGEKNVLADFLNHGLHIAPAKDLMAHSTSLVLVDSLGRSRGYYSGTSPEDIKRLEDDINFLLEGLKATATTSKRQVKK